VWDDRADGYALDMTDTAVLDIDGTLVDTK
jgi:hypothetical protein